MLVLCWWWGQVSAESLPATSAVSHRACDEGGRQQEDPGAGLWRKRPEVTHFYLRLLHRPTHTITDWS
eukprot:8889276-Prorocentrum_lima.AAC.1